MHHGRDQGVTAEEAVLKAQFRGKENMLLRSRNDLHSDPDDLIERLAESPEFYDLVGMPAEALGDAGSKATRRRHRPRASSAMGDLAEDGSRNEALEFLAPIRSTSSLEGGPRVGSAAKA